jgi:hypothetical protein
MLVRVIRVRDVTLCFGAAWCPQETSEQIGVGPGCSARGVAKLSCLGGVEKSLAFTAIFERAFARQLEVAEACCATSTTGGVPD